jgi:hypothetical protein
MNLVIWVQKSGCPARRKTLSKRHSHQEERSTRDRRSKQPQPSGSDTASILPTEPNGTSFVIEEIGETSDDEEDYGHDWKALLAESEAERKQSNTKR